MLDTSLPVTYTIGSEEEDTRLVTNTSDEESEEEDALTKKIAQINRAGALAATTAGQPTHSGYLDPISESEESDTGMAPSCSAKT